jgi:hypothetical protein
LIGSLARDDWSARSDADFVVVVDEAAERFQDRSLRLRPVAQPGRPGRRIRVHGRGAHRLGQRLRPGGRARRRPLPTRLSRVAGAGGVRRNQLLGRALRSTAPDTGWPRSRARARRAGSRRAGSRSWRSRGEGRGLSRPSTGSARRSRHRDAESPVRPGAIGGSGAGVALATCGA